MKTFMLLCCVYVCLCVTMRGGTFELRDRSRTGNIEVISGTLQRIVKTYHCAADNVADQEIILYGTKAWTFPTQNVNLTLKYPSTDSENYEYVKTEGYLITGLLFVLHMDGPESRGYVTQGGILKENISMTFVISNISRLSYQFWLYGIRPSAISNISEYILQDSLC